MNSDQDYTAAGFDSFLSRSVDDLPQTNLDSKGPANNAMPFDRTQVSGALGDTVKIGNIFLDGANSRIIMNDGTNDVLLIGEDV